MLRITDPSQLEHLSPHIRAQLEPHILGTPRAAGETVRRIHEAAGIEAPKVRNRQPEQEAGKMLVQWIDQLVLPNGLRPGLFFAHVANAGVAGGETRGGILQGQGVRKGHPDYILDLPLGRYHGFRLELKAIDGGKPDEDQLTYLERLEAVGFKCAVAWGFDQARASLESYLALAR
jgi:hypothetical protein